MFGFLFTARKPSEDREDVVRERMRGRKGGKVKKGKEERRRVKEKRKEDEQAVPSPLLALA